MKWLNVRDRSAYVRLIGVLFLVFAASGLVSPLMANYVQSLGAGTGEIALVFTTYQAAVLASQYWWGRRSDRIGRRKPLVLIGTAGLALTYLATSAVNWYGWLFIVRIVEGLAFAAYGIGSLALIGDLLEDEAARGRLMGMYRMFGSLAFAIAALSGGWLADAFNLRVPVAVSGLCFGLAFVLVMSIKEKPRADEPVAAANAAGSPGPDTAEAALPANPVARQVLWPFLGLTFAWFFGMGSVVALWPVFMSGNGYSQTMISGLWALAALGEVPGLMLAGYMADRWGRKWVILTGVALMAGVYVSYTFATALYWFIAIQVVRSIAYSCFEAPALLYATELGLRRQRGRLAGLYHSASGVGGITGSSLGGLVAREVGLSPMYRGVAFVMLAVVIVVARVMPRLRPGSQPQSEQATPTVQKI